MDNILIILSDFDIKNLGRILKKIAENAVGTGGIQVVIPVEKMEEFGKGADQERDVSGLNINVLPWNEMASLFFMMEMMIRISGIFFHSRKNRFYQIFHSA